METTLSILLINQKKIISVDIPSGMNSDSGQIMDITVLKLIQRWHGIFEKLVTFYYLAKNFW